MSLECGIKVIKKKENKRICHPNPRILRERVKEKGEGEKEKKKGVKNIPEQTIKQYKSAQDQKNLVEIIKFIFSHFVIPSPAHLEFL